MKSNYTLAEQVAYYRNRCAHQAQEIERLKSEKGYEHIKKQCEKEAQEKNKELAAELRQKNSEASRLRKDCDAANLKIGRYEKTIENLENQLCEIKARLQTMMDNHSQDAASIDAMRKEIDRLTKKGDKSEEAFQRELEEARARINELEQTVQDGEKEKDRLTRQVEALGGETQKLHHQIKLDSTTSSIPTLASHFKPPVTNTRDPSENQQGGQPGHPHHARGLQGIPGKAECTICGLDDPLWADPEYCFERYELKHVVKPVMVIMDQYVFVPVFRNLRTGAHKNAACPDWAFDEFNYGPEAKAMMLYMTFINRSAVRKCADVIRDFSKGVLSPSAGFISGLSVEFAKKSEPERAQSFQTLVDADVMNVDGTVINVGGVYYNVTICVSGPVTGYFFKPYKGDKGVKGTPIESTCAILVSDHDVTYYNYGMGHQECLQHIERYLKDSIAVEPEYTWNVRMLELIQKMIHEAKEVDLKRESKAKQVDAEDTDVVFESEEDGPHPRFSQEMIDSYRRQFDEILQTGLDEYQTTVNKKWYPNGVNLCKRMAEKPDDYLLFMKDDRVPWTNNNAEKAAREIKRKLAAAMTFRGFLGVVAYCESMSVIQVIKRRGMPVLETIAQIFSREITVQDSRRFESVCEDVLREVIEKDEERIRELTGKSIPKTTEKLSKAKETSVTVFNEYERVRMERVTQSGEESEPPEDETKLLVKLNQAEREVYNLEQDIRTLNFKLDKRKKHLDTARKQQESIRKSPCMQERDASQSASEEPVQKTQEDGSIQNARLDTEAISQAIAEEAAVRARLEAAIKRVSQATDALHEILYPSMDIKAGSRKSVFLEKEGIDRSTLPEAVKAQNELDQVRKEVDAIQAELSAVTKKLDALRKGRRPGRRARARNQEQTKDTIGKTG